MKVNRDSRDDLQKEEDNAKATKRKKVNRDSRDQLKKKQIMLQTERE